MKKILSLATLVVITLALGILNSSCGNEDNGVGKPLSAPEYSDVSAKYNISTSNVYKSIELTESGHYVVTLYSSARARTLIDEEVDNTLPTLFAANAQTLETRTTYSGNIIYGKYTKGEDGAFILEDFGTLVISQTEGTNYSLNITLNNGTSATMTASKQSTLPGEARTISLCRTWKISQLNLVATLDGYGVVYNGSVSGGDLPQLMINMLQRAWELDGHSGSMPDSYKTQIKNAYSVVKSITFTQTGSYIVFYEGEKLGVAKWMWTNIDSGILHYSWDYSNPSAQNLSGDVKIVIEGNQCVLKETSTSNGYEFTMTYRMVEE